MAYGGCTVRLYCVLASTVHVQYLHLYMRLGRITVFLADPPIAPQAVWAFCHHRPAPNGRGRRQENLTRRAEARQEVGAMSPHIDPEPGRSENKWGGRTVAELRRHYARDRPTPEPVGGMTLRLGPGGQPAIRHIATPVQAVSRAVAWKSKHRPWPAREAVLKPRTVL